MKLSQLLILLLFLSIFSCNPVQKKSEFNLEEQPKNVLGTDGAAEFFYWEFEDQESLWTEEREGLSGIQEFRDTLLEILGESDFKRVVEKESTQSYPKDSLLGITNGDKINAMLTHTGTIGEIRPINNLEAQLLNYQLKKYPLIAHPTEFHGFIVYHSQLHKYRVYFAASDQPFPPKPNLLITQLESDIKEGWKLKYHLHNHYEPATNYYLGILAPSMSDAQYFKNLLEKYGLEKALITNGIHSVVIDSEDLDRFESY